MGLPQRENRPDLSILPEESDFYTKNKFNEKLEASSCDEDYGDVSGNKNNEPVDKRKGQPEPNGWTWEAYDVFPDTTGEKR